MIRGIRFDRKPKISLGPQRYTFRCEMTHKFKKYLLS